MEGKTEYRKERGEIWDPITGWRPTQVYTEVVSKTKRVNGGSASQVLGSYAIPTGTFGNLRFLEVAAKTAAEWSITDGRGTVWKSFIAANTTTIYNPASPQGFVRGAFAGTFIIRLAGGAAGTYASTFDLALESPQSYLTGTKDIRKA